MRCPVCRSKPKVRFNFRASIMDSLAILFFLVFFIGPGLYLFSQLVWDLFWWPLTVYRPEKRFLWNVFAFLAVAYVSSWLLFTMLEVSGKLRPFLNVLGYFWNYQLRIRYVCRDCGNVVRTDDYPKDPQDE